MQSFNNRELCLAELEFEQAREERSRDPTEIPDKRTSGCRSRHKGIAEKPFKEDGNMHGETGRYTEQLHCPHCGKGFRVELRKMRFDLPSVCPGCGAQCTISGDQAIKAQRLLERLEHRNRAVAAPSHGSIMGMVNSDLALHPE
jgi:hypothetical protein